MSKHKHNEKQPGVNLHVVYISFVVVIIIIFLNHYYLKRQKKKKKLYAWNQLYKVVKYQSSQTNEVMVVVLFI